MTAYSTLGLVYAEKGMCDKAVEQLDKVLTLVGGEAPVEASIKAMVAYAYAASGRKDEALKLATEVSSHPAAPAYWIAQIYARLNDQDQAFEWLERAYAARSFQMVGLKVDPGLDNLRSDPRFELLLDRIGLG